MDLHSGLPFWLVRNALYEYYHPLRENYQTEVAIIGAGITGALVAHELCAAGIACAVFDKRTPSTGSTAASTALLQYETDVPLCEMIKRVGEKTAVGAYQASVQSITDMETLFGTLPVDCDFQKMSSLYLARNRRGNRLLEKEYEVRRKHGIPVEFLSREALLQTHGLEAFSALKNREAAQLDAYRAAIGLLRYHLEKQQLSLFTHTSIEKTKETSSGYELLTATGKIVRCRYLVIAAGFEADKFLPKQVARLHSTYALISQPVPESCLWPERSLIWETGNPYLYMRVTSDNRIIAGGEDVPFKNPQARDLLLRKKVLALEKKIKKLLPDIPFVTDMSWCGTFGATRDGLPYIGCWPGKEKMLFALGYGGNGITFGMIAAQVIRNQIKGQPDERTKLFGFTRGKG